MVGEDYDDDDLEEATADQVIEKDLPILTAEEIEKHKPDVNAACLEELREWVALCGRDPLCGRDQ